MAEPMDPEKYHVLNPDQKRNLILVLLLMLLLTVPTVAYFYYSFAIYRPSQTDKEITFEIKSGDNVSQISQSLYDKGALNSKYLFNFYIIFHKLDKKIQAGVYKIKAGNSIVDLAQLFQHGTNDIRVTFLEGWRVEEFAREATQKFSNVEYEDFVVLAKEYEGYLFPDTYFFNANITTTGLIEELRNFFDKKTKAIFDQGKLNTLQLTKAQTIILASLIEREVPNKDDKKLIAGILLKRLRNKEMLGVDATVQYIAAPLRYGCQTYLADSSRICPTDKAALSAMWWPDDITLSELDLDSVYNTRKKVGLPPAPISSFSISSLNAVLEPKESDYNYYLHDKEGKIHFAKTLAEHEGNIQKYLSK